MTPRDLAGQIVSELPLNPTSRVLEPSFGDGSFLLALVERLMALHEGSPSERLARVLTQNLWGVELDESLYRDALDATEREFGELPIEHNLLNADFFATEFLNGFFDVVVGNPPYGGTFDPDLEDGLDRLYGRWDGLKLKKETYSFFTARSLDWLADDGLLTFIISDTMLTIKTMAGLRKRLMDTTTPSVYQLREFSDETTQPTLVLAATKTPGGSASLTRNGSVIDRSVIESTGNLSWAIDAELAPYFEGRTLGDFIVCTSGMTIGNNELFVRDIDSGQILETHEFDFFEDPITLEREFERARLNKLSPKLQAKFRDLENQGATRRNLRATLRPDPVAIDLPHADYRYYNKADTGIVYAPPRWAVYWKDDGDAVITFKKNGNWYLHGVGGRPYFEREGLTWHLISSRLKMRYLPAGYILDSGAPCAFVRDGVDADELWFILGWCLTDEATRILKTVINHTRNIQSKDVERLPYPWWVNEADKATAVQLTRAAVETAMSGRTFDRHDPEIVEIANLFSFPAD